MIKLSPANKDRVIKLITQETISQQDMEFIVEQYIYAQKGCNTSIDLCKGGFQPGGIHNFILNRQLTMLAEAYWIALGYLSENINEL